MSEVLGSEGMALSQEQINTAMKSPDHLLAWLDATGRRWIVMNGVDLVDSLRRPWPDAVNRFKATVEGYRDHRRGIWTGRERVVTSKVTGESVTVKIMKDETLEIEELDRAIRYLVAQMMERDPTWSLSKPSL